MSVMKFVGEDMAGAGLSLLAPENGGAQLPPCTPPPVNRVTIQNNNLNKLTEGGKGGAMPPPYNPPPTSSFLDLENLGSDGVALETIIPIATEELRLPIWFVYYWHRKMVTCGWRNKNGRIINARNWKRTIVKWWNWTTREEKLRFRSEYEAEKAAAQAAENPPRKIKLTRMHWYACQSLCKNYQYGKCVQGSCFPPCLSVKYLGSTRACKRFDPTPFEWQNVWILDKVAEYEAMTFAPARELLHHVQAYFAAHPEELVEAKWRREANWPSREVQEEINACVDAMLTKRVEKQAEREE